MNQTKSKTLITKSNAIEASEEDYLFTQASQIKAAGKGLFTAIDIFKNEIISLFTGETINSIEAEKRVQNNQDRYFIVLLDGNILDSMHTKCFAKFANDSFGTSFKNNAKITLDEDENVCLMATRNIKAGEEIFCNYGKAYWQKHG